MNMQLKNIWPFNKNKISIVFILTCFAWYLGLFIISSLILAHKISANWVFFYVISFCPIIIIFTFFHIYPTKIKNHSKMSKFHIFGVTLYMIWFLALIAISAVYKFTTFNHPQLIFEQTMGVVYISVILIIILITKANKSENNQVA